jgi:hypothetical protein
MKPQRTLKRKITTEDTENTVESRPDPWREGKEDMNFSVNSVPSVVNSDSVSSVVNPALHGLNEETKGGVNFKKEDRECRQNN